MRIALGMWLLAGLLAIAGPAAAKSVAADYDGRWSVLVVTDRGTCDHAYRYEVNIRNGRLHYLGKASVNLRGAVENDGAVKVSLRLGTKGASGKGHLSKKAGAGTWHGFGGSSKCSGHWEAERR